MSPTSSEKKIADPQAQPLFWLLLMGVAIGLAFLMMSQLSRKWFTFLFLASMLLPIALAVENRKQFFLALLTLSVPIWIGMHVSPHKTVYGRSTFGFPIHFSFIPLTALYLTWIVNRMVHKLPGPISTRGLVSLACLLGVGACSVLVARSPLFATFDLFALATSMAIFVYVSSQVIEMKELRLIVTILIVFAIIQGIVAVGQKLTGSHLGLMLLGPGAMAPLYGYTGLEAISRVGGWIGHPNSLAMFFDLLLPLSFSLLFYPMSRGLKALLGVGVVIEILGLGVTYSRGGIVSSSLAILFLLLFYWKKKMGLTRAVFGVLSIAIFASILLLVIPNPLRTGLFRTEGTAYGRWPLAKVAMNIISHHPLLGTGLNNFVETARPYDRSREQIVSSWNSPVHNLFLFIGSEMGLLGLVFFSLFLWRVMTWLYPALSATDPFLRCTGAGLFLGLLAFFAHAQVDYGIWTQNRLLWFLLGLAITVGSFTRLALENQKVSAPQESGA
jgi:O-antigen ligase